LEMKDGNNKASGARGDVGIGIWVGVLPLRPRFNTIFNAVSPFILIGVLLISNRTRSIILSTSIFIDVNNMGAHTVNNIVNTSGC